MKYYEIVKFRMVFTTLGPKKHFSCGHSSCGISGGWLDGCDGSIRTLRAYSHWKCLEKIHGALWLQTSCESQVFLSHFCRFSRRDHFFDVWYSYCSDFCMGRSLVAFWKHHMKCWPFFFPGSLCVFPFFPCHEIPRDPMKGSWDPPFDSAWVVRSSTAKWTHESGIVENENLPVEGWEIPNTLGCWDCWDGMVGCGLEKASISWRRLGVIFIILMLRFIHLFSCIYLQYITLHGRLLPHKIHKSQDIVLRWNAFTLRTKHRCMNEINAKLSHSRNGESLTSQLAGNRIVASHDCRTKKAWKN